MKLKSLPDDFIVKERIKPEPKDRGAYTIYKVEKKGLTTDQLVQRLSRWMHRPANDFSFAGMKDRHGVTFQYLSLKGSGPKQVTTDSFTASRIGFLDQAIGPRSLSGNEFDIVVRDLDQSLVERICNNWGSASAQGIPNYYDDQRFRSQKSVKNAFGFYLLRQDFAGALQIYVSECLTKSKSITREAAGSIIGEWGNWRSIQGQVTEIQDAIDYLQANPRDFQGAILRLNRTDTKMMVSAAYSFLWNECLKRHIKYRAPSKSFTVKGAWQDYHFYSQLDDDDQAYLEQLKISVPARDSKTDQGFLSEICASFGLDSERLSSAITDKVHPGGITRKALMHPESLSLSSAMPDDLNSGKLKLRLSFSLGPGSYATMVVKRLVVA